MEYIFDDNQVRYHCAKKNSQENLNWLFFPGGPGADSQYLMSLIKNLDIPGNICLINMPGKNAGHIPWVENNIQYKGDSTLPGFCYNMSKTSTRDQIGVSSWPPIMKY